MKQITIFKDGVITNGPASFETESELNEWFNRHEEMGTFRTSEKQIITTDIDGNESVETLPITHTFEIMDITAKTEQERINSEALSLLASTDWYVTRFIENGTSVPVDISNARAEARAKIVK